MDAKVQGQQDSLLDLLEEPAQAFIDAITAIPSGREFSINDIRATLDRFEVPAKSRAGLFARAMSQGLMKPHVVTVGGMSVAVTVPSTGESAHKATVKVYIRT